VNATILTTTGIRTGLTAVSDTLGSDPAVGILSFLTAGKIFAAAAANNDSGFGFVLTAVKITFRCQFSDINIRLQFFLKEAIECIKDSSRVMLLLMATFFFTHIDFCSCKYSQI
jgi:hypothetical protein